MHLSSSFLTSSLLIQALLACQVDVGKYSAVDYALLTATNIQVREARASQIRQLDPPKIAIRNIHVFDGQKIGPLTTIVIANGLIGTNDTDATIVDGNGGVLVPGFIDSHCHPSKASDLEDLTGNGVTTAISMACYSPEMCQSLQNHQGLVDIKLSTAPAANPGSVHGNISVMATKSTSLLISQANQVPSWIENQTSWDPYIIKAIAEPQGLDQTTLTAIAEAAEQKEKHSVCHAAFYQAYSQAVTASFSQVHHTPLDQPVDANLIRFMLQQKQVSAPTLTIMKAIANEKEPRAFANANASVAAIHAAGIPILAGTDANLQPGLIASVPFGTSLHDELELLVEAGLSPVEALNSATINPASHFGLTDRGIIAPGMRADLVLLGSNPTHNISATRDIRGIWAAGIPYMAKPNSTNPSNYSQSSTTIPPTSTSIPPASTPITTSSSPLTPVYTTFGILLVIAGNFFL